MLPFIRSDLAQLTAYKPHPEIEGDTPATAQVDRLDTNESPFDLPDELKRQLAWTYQQVIEANRYPDGGHIALKQAIAEYVNESANLSRLDATYISVGNGSYELIRSLLIATCLQGQGSILVANPTFSMYAILAQTLGIPVVTVGRSESDFEVDLAAAQAAVAARPTTANGSARDGESTESSVRVVFMVHPNSPTGNRLTTAELSWLESLPPHILVVIDEAYFEFSHATVVQQVLQRPNWIVLRTFSKAFRLAAYRVGYCVAHPELVATLEKVRLPYNLPAFSQAAAQVALHHRQALLQAIPHILAERERLAHAFAQEPKLRVWPSAANFLYLRLQDTTVAADGFAQVLRAQGTSIRHVGGGLRVTVGSEAENARTLERFQSTLAQSPVSIPA